MLDGDALLFQLLRKGIAPEVTLKPDLEVDAIDRFPYVTFTGIGGAALNDRGSLAPIAWDWNLTVNVFDTDLDDCKAVATAFYDLVHSWNDPWGTAHMIPGLGHATQVSDLSLFSKVGSADIPGHTVQQLAGSFALQLHSA